MAAKHEQPKGKAGGAEKFSRFWRNVHFAGAIALAAAAVEFPGAAVVLNTGAAFEAVHGGAWEAGRRHFKKKRQNKH